MLSALANCLSAAICPSTAATNTDCGFILTIGAGGSISGVPVANANPYDGSDDALVGVINNSGNVFNGSITLTGSGNGGGIFAFDGDGICTYVRLAYCNTAPTGYEGPLVTFMNIRSMKIFDDTGDVVIQGLADGATTYFSIEGAPSSIDSSNFAPEPATMSLFGGGLLALVYVQRKCRKVSDK